jgi:hypothetical protein
MFTMKPVSPAHCLLRGSTVVDVKDSRADRSFRSQVLPMEKVPLAFSLDLCMRTRPDLRTATMMIRGFSVWELMVSGGGGVDG